VSPYADGRERRDVLMQAQDDDKNCTVVELSALGKKELPY